MSKSIKLSPKHGVNPTIPVCFWCGKPKNEIALMGRIGDGRRGEDKAAPQYSLLDYRPCDDCQARMSGGFTVIEVTKSPNSTTEVAIQEGFYPTSRYVVVKKEAAENIFGKEYVARGRCIMLDTDFNQMFGEVLK